MPRFYFDIDGDVTLHDRDGRELPDRFAACREAVVVATDYAMSGVSLPAGGDAVVRVRFGQDRVLCTVRLSCRMGAN